jgi:hemerythrin-like domain-containing protein
VLEYHRLVHNRIRPHCPEENGVIERANRTLREKLDELELKSRREENLKLKQKSHTFTGQLKRNLEKTENVLLPAETNQIILGAGIAS